ncbi:acyl-CoA dehydrogenase family protein [Roseococcus pinisoli]|uniref:Acyl-CoA dehydrogenase family protein n=1 Tax=Roseococcus pinisoli TaxID=2835040 RepID=A0ABS5QKJ5_9PROT|nr:acyl-CoA dehydrogenase family protein [Roseococcus pinisoli]MBS7813515.1 acyl-CoA dehydrogenase family protein [Roseococcus pinisoli]
MSASAAGVAPFSGDRAESIEMIRDSARGLLGTDLARVRKLRFTEPGFDGGLLRQMGEAGWIGLAVSEEAGGTGLGMGEMVALAEEAGRALAPEPLIGCALSAHLLAAAGATELLGQLLAGEAVVLTAWQDRANTLSLASSAEGARAFVPMAGGATHILWPVAEGKGVALHLLTRDQVTITTEATQDGGHLGTVAPKPFSGHGPGQHIADDIGAALTEALDRAALATAASLLGGMEASFAMTLEYLKTRQQFGKIIGTFQSLQHKAADAKMQVALTRAAVEQAAAALDDGATGEAAQAIVSRAKARASEAGMLVAQACVQLHGGIGYTDDYDVGLYMRRAMVQAPALGGAALHRKRFMALAPETEE